MVLLVYFSAIAMMSLKLNSLLGMPTGFLASVGISLMILIVYLIYVIVWVRPFRLFELYKINNLCRIIGLAILPLNVYGGIIVIDIVEITFFLIDLGVYRHEKLSVRAYIVERICLLLTFNGAIFSEDYTAVLGVVGFSMGVIFFIKMYYTAITVKRFIDERKLVEAT